VFPVQAGDAAREGAKIMKSFAVDDMAVSIWRCAGDLPRCQPG
jgi:hypothetical protein